MISLLNFIFGYFVLPETLKPENRRPFSLANANPFGTFKVFRTYAGVMPLVGVLAVFFFASSIYPAIWPFWGIARFGWTETIIGLTLAAFGIVAAITQGVLSGPLVKRFGEHKVALTGLIFAVVAAIGYGFAGSLPVVLVLLVIHAPEGLVHPMLIALMSKAVPDDAQGQLQGGISSVMNVVMLAGTVLYAQLFGYFHVPELPTTAGYAFFAAAALIFVALVMFAVVDRDNSAATAAAAD